MLGSTHRTVRALAYLEVPKLVAAVLVDDGLRNRLHGHMARHATDHFLHESYTVYTVSGA